VTRGHVLRNYHAVVARQKDAGRLDEFMFGFSNGELLFSSHVWRGKVTQPLPETAGPWLHVAASRHRDGTTVLFADGREIGRGHTGPGLLDPGGNPLILGGARNDPTSRTQARFDGQIDEVRIYDRALAPAEIAALAAAPGK
jgi:prepilin-type processing-associated H-X9-DG protein